MGLLPKRWIRAVMQVESGGNAHAVSPKGALWLMQMMPETWVGLSVRYDLGLDPFDARDNIRAGNAYLREMLDRLGLEGFLAAYNGGPRRYEERLATGRPLPEETQICVARLATLIGIGQRDCGSSIVRHRIAWQRAPVFVVRSDASSADGNLTSGVHRLSASTGTPKLQCACTSSRPTGLLVQPSGEVRSR